MKVAPRRPDQNPQGLDQTEQKFIEKFADPKSDTFLNGKRSYMATHPNANEHTAESAAPRFIRRPDVYKTLKERFNHPNIWQKIISGMEKRLDDPDSRHFQPSAEFVAKIAGAFAPEKHINVNIGEEERDQFYEQVMKKIETVNEPKVELIPEKADKDGV